MNGKIPVGKRELGKLLTKWKHGKLSKRQIDEALGVPQWGGKKITELWETHLGVKTSGRNTAVKV